MDNIVEKLQQEIESLKKQIDTLEKNTNNKKSNIISGRSYSQIGDSDSDFLIKTRGQVKIQWGNKFIDLIKDGKINTNSKFIFLIDDKDSIGTKNGLYVTKAQEVYLKINDNLINLFSTVGSSQISQLWPKGTIIMFSGLESEIPSGWAICDGSNNTPNLLNYFIKAEENQDNTIIKINYQSYFLIYIMKVV